MIISTVRNKYQIIPVPVTTARTKSQWTGLGHYKFVCYTV